MPESRSIPPKTQCPSRQWPWSHFRWKRTCFVNFDHYRLPPRYRWCLRWLWGDVRDSFQPCRDKKLHQSTTVTGLRVTGLSMRASWKMVCWDMSCAPCTKRSAVSSTATSGCVRRRIHVERISRSNTRLNRRRTSRTCWLMTDGAVHSVAEPLQALHIVRNLQQLG